VHIVSQGIYETLDGDVLILHSSMAPHPTRMRMARKQIEAEGKQICLAYQSFQSHFYQVLLMSDILLGSGNIQ
jgi:hypothetical protein